MKTILAILIICACFSCKRTHTCQCISTTEAKWPAKTKVDTTKTFIRDTKRNADNTCGQSGPVLSTTNTSVKCNLLN